MSLTLREQLNQLKSTIRGTNVNPELAGPDSELLKHWADIIVHFPGSISSGEMKEIEKLICACFSITPKQWNDILVKDPKAVVPKKRFEELIPDGWLADYIEKTKEAEPPTVFHFFCAATVLGTLTERKVWISRGHYRIFPNLNVILIAPTGKARKSSAINISKDIIMEAGFSKLVLGQTTPEAFIMALGSTDPASCLIVGSEMKRFFHSAKYMDGFVPLITDLTDSPDRWSSMTIARSKLELKNVLISAMYGTTMNWLKSMPSDVFGGGFLRRHVVVVQERTDRISAWPGDMTKAKTELAEKLKALTLDEGEFERSDEVNKWYTDWYATFRSRDTNIGDELFEGYLESKPDQVLRLAMIIQISKGIRKLTIESLESSIAILDWLDQFLPTTFAGIGGSPLSELQERIIKYIKVAGGRMSHSDLVRRMSKWLTAGKLAEHLNTLIEANRLEEKPKTNMEPRSYYLKKGP
jgi:hypothetical protein